MDTKYFGSWDRYDELWGNFQPERYGENKDPEPEGFPTEDEVLFAAYGGYSYEGSAIVIYEKNGTLYEVNGGHCSCNGLEGQWSPEETSWQALALRTLDEAEFGRHTVEFFDKLVASHLKQ